MKRNYYAACWPYGVGMATDTREDCVSLVMAFASKRRRDAYVEEHSLDLYAQEIVDAYTAR